MAVSCFTYRLLNMDDFPAVFRLLNEHYAPNYPILKHLGGGEEDACAYFSLAKVFLKQGNSLGTFSKDDKLCGAIPNVAPYKDEYGDFQSNVTSFVAKAIGDLMYKLVGGDLSDVSKLLGTDKYWEMKMATVDSNFQGMKVMSELIKRTMELAKKNGMKKIIKYDTYDHTERSLRKLGSNFYVLRRIDFLDYEEPNTGKKILADMKPPYTAQVMIVGNV